MITLVVWLISLVTKSQDPPSRTEHALDQAASQLELRLTNPEGFAVSVRF